jgi:hypothetical protein
LSLWNTNEKTRHQFFVVDWTGTYSISLVYMLYHSSELYSLKDYTKVRNLYIFKQIDFSYP